MYRFLPLFFLPLAALAADELPGVVVPKKPVGGLYDTCAIQVVQLSKGEKAWVTGNCSTRHGDQMESHLCLCGSGGKFPFLKICLLVLIYL
ncbi:hypothetical protein AO1008_07869 [Aspergillus oryzae 100-8]|uniref:Cyanovirin-N domain-containing protein n=1 Tax=Aspergillus oryzae (strain 3.042) TaxID=1160506 RepID=I7ZSE2_ASPO3|nr:hypothetical protein Ao3042_08992 [Aspergillus oryzae 3.042]KDE81225.1 hypothetical protein AO1008_07869 [Aspergillus oryzae 100-8]|eukprot:EIT74827.1 hypothetical protein Ao3042_08992 [Aspergillus oryzae 3.042]